MVNNGESVILCPDSAHIPHTAVDVCLTGPRLKSIHQVLLAFTTVAVRGGGIDGR